MKEKSEKNKSVRPGVKFRERNSSIVYAVVSVDARTVSYRSDHGQREVSFGTCPVRIFESRMENRDIEIVP
jgi:hypothetical protein